MKAKAAHVRLERMRFSIQTAIKGPERMAMSVPPIAHPVIKPRANLPVRLRTIANLVCCNYLNLWARLVVRSFNKSNLISIKLFKLL
jgi:hypothetical protein